MAWFNTDWDIANIFNSPTVGGNMNNPYGFTGGAGGNMITPWNNTVTGETWDAPSTGYIPPNSNWQMTGGNKTDNLNSVWGAPAYYQSPSSQNNIFGNNPYQTQGGGYYNPYQFGQVDYPYQYGGNNTNQQEQPWWMNYNTNSSSISPTSTPTTNPMDQGKYVGNPNHGGDEYETGPVYATADAAMEAGDYWSAYRKDHQQWRDSQGIYASGGGKEDGQSDLHYPGNPTLGIRPDAYQLNAMGMGGMFESQLPTAEQKKLLSMFSATPNAQGGNDYKVIGDGTVVLPNGTTVETQLTEKERFPYSGDWGEGGIERGAGPTYQGGIATMDNLFRMFNADREKNQSLRKEQWDFQNHFGETDHWNLGRPGDSNYVPFVPTYNPNARQNFPNENELVDSSNIFLPKTAEDWAKEYETDRVYQHKPATNLDPFNQVSNYGYQPNTSPFNQASNYNYQQAENNIFSPNDNTQRKLGFAESAALKASTQAKNWVNMGLSAEKAAELAKMSWSDANKLEKKQGFNPKYTGKDAVSKTNYLRQGIGSMVGQNAVPGSNVGGGTALTQKLFQNPFIKAITSNPYAARAATGLGLLGTAGMAYGAFDAGKGVANYAIDKLGVRDNLTSIGSNIAKGVEANRVHAANIKLEKDAGTFQPRVTAPAKKAAAKKKVVKKATPKRVTVNYNKNRPVAVKSKPTRTPAPKVTRTTGSRGGRGNVAKKKSAPSKSYSSYSRRVGGR